MSDYIAFAGAVIWDAALVLVHYLPAYLEASFSRYVSGICHLGLYP
jgi:hypothetical protein